MSGLVSIKVPPVPAAIASHHAEARALIAKMSPSRAWGAEAELKSWRRLVEKIDPAEPSGWGLIGRTLDSPTPLLIGTLFIAVDQSFARAKWYAHSAPTGGQCRSAAMLYEVQEDGPAEIYRTTDSKWARRVIDWISLHRPSIPHGRSERR